VSKHRQLSYGQAIPQDFLDALQEFLGSSQQNVTLTQISANQIQILAGTGNAQVALGIDGLWRYVTVSVTTSVPGSTPGTYDVFATTGNNSFATNPSPPPAENDNTDYTFALQTLTQGQVPATAHYRKIGEVVFDGTRITNLRQTLGVDSSARWQPGDIKMSGAATIPAGWLACDGTARSRTTYAALYAALGGTTSPWGQGDGSTTFNVPDLRGRTPIGTGQGAGLTNRVLGTYGGGTLDLASPKLAEEAHVLLKAELAVHNHGGLTGTGSTGTGSTGTGSTGTGATGTGTTGAGTTTPSSTGTGTTGSGSTGTGVTGTSTTGAGATLAGATTPGTTGPGSTGTGVTGGGTTGTGSTGTSTTGAGVTGGGTSGPTDRNIDHLHGAAAQAGFVYADGSLQANNVWSPYIAAGHSLGVWANAVSLVGTTGAMDRSIDHLHSVPSLSVPGLSVPSLSIPGLSIPGLSIPSLSIAGHSIPALTVPPLTVPALSVPALTVPSLSIAGLSVPALTIPGLTVPGLSIPALSVPSLSVPSLSVPSLSVPALTVANDGSGTAHNSMQPFAAVAYLIKT
jgi:microcystin-dependent protein